MDVLAFAALLLLAMAGQSSANWCVCKEGLGDAVWQKTLDYACGAGADCNPIHSNGGCYNPNTVKAHCNYAVNSYFQKKGQAQGSCDFAGTANPVTSDPSITGCVYPSSASTAGTTTTPVTNTPGTPSTGTGTGTGTPSTGTGTGTGTGTTTPTTSTTPTTGTTTPTTTTPYTATPGVLGGIGTGVGPSGAGINSDDSGVIRLVDASLFSSILTLFVSGLMLWWG
ncbi:PLASMODESMATA CALLOSE-BINDING PROTEIN 3-like [Prunus avium]|uniref:PLASMODESMATA CALLOSE-BINDING PROTEIN 3-like n=1 Tax=Prunus avium TaxID=42229 RepID=A0A6P5S2W1_PRUAV|nr:PLASMODESMATA CALLOSE-BINDING PROTEIN 3-like [Prunus avium]